MILLEMNTRKVTREIFQDAFKVANACRSKSSLSPPPETASVIISTVNRSLVPVSFSSYSGLETTLTVEGPGDYARGLFWNSAYLCWLQHPFQSFFVVSKRKVVCYCNIFWKRCKNYHLMQGSEGSASPPSSSGLDAPELCR